MKKIRKSKLKFGRILILLLIIFICTFLSIKFCISLIEENIGEGLGTAFANITKVASGQPQYKPIHEDTNVNYGGKRKGKNFWKRSAILLLLPL